MSRGGWKYVAASAVGTSHERQQLPCQDACVCEILTTEAGKPVLVAAVSDGAGSASRAEVGSQLACQLFLQEMKDLLEDGGDVPDVTHELAQQWLTFFQNRIAQQAEAEGLTPRDFACTFLAAVIGEGRSAFLQVGDGAIVVALQDFPEQYQCVFWPQRGEYENVTHFATDPSAQELLLFKPDDWRIEEVALFTDGLQRLALHFETRTAFLPFFRPMFAPLANQPEGNVAPLTKGLETFLGSAAVNARTDDDKTLILATRRAVEPVEPVESAPIAEPEPITEADPCDAAV